MLRGERAVCPRRASCRCRAALGGRVSASGGALAPVGAAVRVGRLCRCRAGLRPGRVGSGLCRAAMCRSDLCVGRAPALSGHLCPCRAVHLVLGSPPLWGRPLPLPGGSARLGLPALVRVGARPPARQPRPCQVSPPLPGQPRPCRAALPASGFRPLVGGLRPLSGRGGASAPAGPASLPRPSPLVGCPRPWSAGPMSVRIERAGPVTTVVLSRPAARNAVDGPTARALADAFRAFDADAEASVAVLWGEGGTFCAGADLKAIGTSDGNEVMPDGDGPMGPPGCVCRSR